MSGFSDIEETQKEICLRYGFEFASSPTSSIVGVALSTLGKWPINGLRHPAVKGTNGWYIWCGEVFSDDANFFSPLHLEHLFEKCPDALPLLGLPPGCRFLIGKAGYQDVWFDAGLLRV